MGKTLESLIEQWKQYTLAELGQWVHLLVMRSHHRSDMDERIKDITNAQNYLDMMQAHILAAWDAVPNVTLAEPKSGREETSSGGLEDTNPILAELPMVVTTEPKLQYKGLAEVIEANRTEAEEKVVEAIAANPMLEPKPEPEGIIYGDDGNVIAISAQDGERGYDPDAHEKQIRIFCDGEHIEAAHTADVEAGTVKYYYRNEKHRLKTGTHTGKVEIRVHIPDGEVEIPIN